MKPIIITILLCSAALCATAQDSTAEKVKTAVESKNYKISVNMALPQRGSTIPLTSSYDIAVRGDSAMAYLPYFGTSRQSHFGDTEGGIKFTEPTSNYKVTANKNKGYKITFNVQSPNDSYAISLDIYPNGNAYVAITPTNSDFISYQGEVEFPK